MKQMTAEWVADAATDAQARCRCFRSATRDALGLEM